MNALNHSSKFVLRCVVLPYYGRETDDWQMPALQAYFDYLAANGSLHPSLWFSELNLLGGPGSLVNSPSPAATDAAFSERGALWVVQQ